MNSNQGILLAIFMFNVLCRVEKARSVDGEFRISGIASDTSIDRDKERFSAEAIEDMRKGVIENHIPLRVEHERGWYQEIGEIVDATINEKGQLWVEAVVDQEMSLGRDFVYICNQALKGKRELPGFSVGGEVLDIMYEMDSEGEFMRVFNKVILTEISLVTYPSNMNVTLQVPISKSVKWDETVNKAIETDEGKRLKDYFNKTKHVMAKVDFRKGVLVDRMKTQSEICEIMWDTDADWHLEKAYYCLQGMLQSADITDEVKTQAISEMAEMLIAFKNLVIDKLSAEEKEEVIEDTGDMSVNAFMELMKSKNETMPDMIKKVIDAHAEINKSVEVSYIHKDEVPAALSIYVKSDTMGLKVVTTTRGEDTETEISSLPEESWNAQVTKTVNEEEEKEAEAEVLETPKETPTVEEQHIEAEELSEEVSKAVSLSGKLAKVADALVVLDSNLTLKSTKVLSVLTASLSGASAIASDNTDETTKTNVLKSMLEYGKGRVIDFVKEYETLHGLGLKQDIAAAEMEDFIKYVDNFIAATALVEVEKSEPTPETVEVSGGSDTASMPAADASEGFDKSSSFHKFSALVQEKVDEITKSVNAKLELQAAKIKAMEESGVEKSTTIEELQKMVTTMAQHAVPRKAVVSHVALKASEQETPLSLEEKVKMNMKKGNTSWHEAYAAARQTENL